MWLQDFARIWSQCVCERSCDKTHSSARRVRALPRARATGIRLGGSGRLLCRLWGVSIVGGGAGSDGSVQEDAGVV